MAGKKKISPVAVLELENWPTEKCQEALLGEEDKMLGSHWQHFWGQERNCWVAKWFWTGF